MLSGVFNWVSILNYVLKGYIDYSKDMQNLSIVEGGYLVCADNASQESFGGFWSKPNIKTLNMGKSISEACGCLFVCEKIVKELAFIHSIG